MIENYCLGFCTEEEVQEVEKLAAIHPAIQSEIEKIRDYFEKQIYDEAIQPSASVKLAILEAVYKQQAADDHRYAPLININTPAAELEEWVALNKIETYGGEFENLYITALPSANKVINFIIAAKNGHDEELHEDFIEYLFVIAGGCTMDFEGKEIHYRAGEIISILPNVKHSAIITSKHPMLALVQRQFYI